MRDHFRNSRALLAAVMHRRARRFPALLTAAVLSPLLAGACIGFEEVAVAVEGQAFGDA